MKDYQKSIMVNNPVSEVYAAVTECITDWWSDDFSGASVNKGDQFDIAFGETKKTFETVEANPNKRVIWRCTKAYIDMETLTKRSEWVGTRLIWTINSNGQYTTLTMLHEGLNKNVECYDICEPAWDYFIASIQTFLITGTGTPYRKKVAKLEWEEK